MRNFLKSLLDRDIFFACLLAVLVLLALSPLLLGYIFFDEEQLGFYYPQSFFYGQALQHGASLYWDNFHYGGVSVALDQFVSAFYPPHWVLFRYLPAVMAHHVSIILAVIGGCLCAYWFGRESKFGKPASFILATSYLLATTFNWLDIGTLAAHSFLIFPVLMLAILKISRGEHPVIFSFLGGTALGVGLLAGFPQVIFYEYAAFFFWALFLSWKEGNGSRWHISKRVLAGWIAITAIGIILGGRQSIPSAIFINDTVRSASLATEKAVSPKLTELLTVVFPEYMSLPFFGAGSPGLYAGSLGLILALFGLVFFRTQLSLFFLVLYGMILAVAFHLPIFSWLNEHIPPFSHMSGQFRWLTAGALPLAYLAAHGFEAITARPYEDKKIRKFLRVVGCAIGLVAIITILGGIAVYAVQSSPGLQQKIVDWRFIGKAKSFPNDYYLDVLKMTISGIAKNFSIFQWRLYVPLLILVSSLALIAGFLKKKIPHRAFIWASIMLVATNIFLVPAAKLRDAYVRASVFDAEPQISRVIKSRENDLNSFRMAGFLIGDSLFWDVMSKRILSSDEISLLYRELMVNDINIFYGLQRIDGMEPYRTLRHNQLLDTVLFPKGLSVFDASSPAYNSSRLQRYINNDILKEVSIADKVADFRKHISILSMLNVKYLYSLIPVTDPRLKEIPLEDNPVVPAKIHLYENTGVLPRIFFPRSVSFYVGRDNELLKQVAENKDFLDNSFIECRVCSPGGLGRKDMKISMYEPGDVRINAETERGGWLIFGESAVPGWKATIDGFNAPMYTANYIFQGVYVPPGVHEIKFQYNDITATKWNQIKRILMKR